MFLIYSKDVLSRDEIVAEYWICDLVKLNLLPAYPIWFIEKFVKILVVKLKSGSEFEKNVISKKCTV